MKTIIKKISILSLMAFPCLVGCQSNEINNAEPLVIEPQHQEQQQNQENEILKLSDAKKYLEQIPESINLMNGFNLTNKKIKERSISTSKEIDAQLHYDSYSAVKELSDSLTSFVLSARTSALEIIDSVSDYGTTKLDSGLEVQITSSSKKYASITYSIKETKDILGIYNSKSVKIASYDKCTFTYAIGEKQFSYLIHYDGVKLENKYFTYDNKLVAEKDVFDTYFYINGDEETYSTVSFVNFDCNYLSHSYTTMEKIDGGAKYLEYKKSFGDWSFYNALNVNIYRNGLCISNSYEQRMGEEFPEFDIFNSDTTRVHWTTQINNGEESGICLFPWADVDTISGNMVSGWESMTFDDLYPNPNYLLGFLGYIALGINVGETYIDFDSFYNFTALIPLSSLIGIRDGFYAPYRLAFARNVVAGDEEKSIYDLFKSNLELGGLSYEKQNENFESFLKNTKRGDFYNLSSVDKYGDVEAFNKWMELNNKSIDKFISAKNHLWY